jgi:hypothetical protein
MKNMTNLKELKAFIKTEEAFQGEFIFKGFSIWWNEYDVTNPAQGTDDGYFRCDPCTDKQYNDFHKLEEKMFGGFEWVLS